MDDGHVVAVSAAGQIAWDVRVGSYKDEQVHGLMALPAGGVVIVGRRPGGAAGDEGWAARLTEGGSVFWQTHVQAGDGGGFEDAALASDGALLAVGGHSTTAQRGWIVRLDATTTKVLDQRSYGETKAQRLYAISNAASGPLVVGELGSPGYGVGWMLRLDNALQPLWTYKTAAIGQFRAVSEVSGRITLAGMRRASDGKQDAVLLAFDPFGNPLWDRSFDAGTFESLRGLAVDASGEVLTVGRTEIEAGAALLVRSSAFGQASCAAAGVCAAKSVADCDDGQPCTVDGCAPQQGCKQTPAPGQACSDGDGCSRRGTCKGKSCVVDVQGKLHVRSVDLSGLVAMGRGATVGADRLLLVGKDAEGSARLVTLDAYGDAAGKGVTLEVDARSVAGAVPMADGGAVVGWDTASDAIKIARVAANGDVLWTSPVSAPSTAKGACICDKVDCSDKAKAWTSETIKAVVASDSGQNVTVVSAGVMNEPCKVSGVALSGATWVHHGCLLSRRFAVADGKLLQSQVFCSGWHKLDADHRHGHRRWSTPQRNPVSMSAVERTRRVLGTAM